MKRYASRGFAALAVVLLAGLPRAAHACPVCFGGDADNRAEFIGTTLFLTLLPLLMIGGLALFLWRRTLRLAEDARAPQPAERERIERPRRARA